MLHNTLSALLVSVANRYAQLSPSDVGIGIGGGRLVIDDVQLRTEPLNGPHTPFDVQHGRAGRLRVNVPWGALSSSPVQVYLENVHLIVTPKREQPSIGAPEKPAPASAPAPEKPASSAPDHPWHQTNVGRLLFNVSVEVYGLKVEYRDESCIGVLSIASLRAFSAGPDWSMRFVSLVPDLDRDQPDATAVAMRKTVNLTGVHFVMIPRSKTSLPSNDREKEQQHQQDSASIHPNSDRNLDLESYESQNPILDGVSIALRVLLCTGATVLKDSGELTPGMHGEVFVEMDEPSVKLTARQITWLENILRQGLGTEGDASNVNITIGTKNANEKQRALNDNATDRNATTVAGATDDKSQQNPDPVPVSSKSLADAGGANDKENNDGEINKDDGTSNGRNVRSAPDLRASKSKTQNTGRGSLRTVWEAIVGENTDETVDDAAVALGLWTAKDDAALLRAAARRRRKEEKQALAAEDEGEEGGHIDDDEGVQHDDDKEESDDDDDDLEDDEEEDEGDEDMRYARKAVGAAAACGGVSWHVRLRTADTRAWNRVKDLEKEVEIQTKGAQKAEQAEKARKEAEDRAREQQGQIEQLSARLEDLLHKNKALAVELDELEQMASEAGRNKDMIIRKFQETEFSTPRPVETQPEPAVQDNPNVDGQNNSNGYNNGINNSHNNDNNQYDAYEADQQNVDNEIIVNEDQGEQTEELIDEATERNEQGDQTERLNSEQQHQSQQQEQHEVKEEIEEEDDDYSHHVHLNNIELYQQTIHQHNIRQEEKKNEQLQQLFKQQLEQHQLRQLQPQPPPAPVPAPVEPEKATTVEEESSSGVNEGESETLVPTTVEQEVNSGAKESADENGQIVVVLGDDTGNLTTDDEATRQNEQQKQQQQQQQPEEEHPENSPVPEKTESVSISVDSDLAQNASLQSFYNNDDVNKLEQRMGVQGLTLI